MVLREKLPLLITGIAGVAGYNAFQYFRRKFPGQVFGLRPDNNWRLNGEGVLAGDLEDFSKLSRFFQEYRFRSVLHCGGSCALKSCELDPIMAHRVNVMAVDSLLSSMEQSAIAKMDQRLVFLSIDLVFSGFGGGDYRETDSPDPVTIYGKTMVQGEKLVGARFPGATILRISLPMGVSFNGHAGAVDWIASRFKKRFPATLYYDEIRTPTYVDCLNQVAEHFLNGDLAGLFHAGGPRKLSLFEIAQVVNLVGGYRPCDLKGCYRLEAGPVPPRAGNVSMNSEKLGNELGREPFLPWPLDSKLVPEGRFWHEEMASGPKYSEHFEESKIERLLYQPNRIG